MAHVATIEADAAAEPAKPARWTSLNILIHWTIVVLLAIQAITQLGISEFYRGMEAGVPPGNEVASLGIAHMIVGSAIFLLMIWRLVDLHRHGRPPHPPGEPGWSKALSTANHWAFYVILTAMPVAGALAFFLDLPWLGEIHGWAGVLLLPLVALHVAGALAHKYWFKTSALKRKLPGNDYVPGRSAALEHYRDA